MSKKKPAFSQDTQEAPGGPTRPVALTALLRKPDSFRVAEMQGEVQDIEEKRFLRDAQRTNCLKIEIPRTPLIRDFGGPFASFGSCFAQNLQTWLTNYGFPFWFERDICAHYSTESIANALTWVTDQLPHSRDEFYHYHDDRGGFSAYRYFFKKRFFGPEGERRAFARMAELDALCTRIIQSCDYLVITLGTPRIIRLRRNNDLINAAHGAPPSDWVSEMLSVDENVKHLERIYETILRLRAGAPPIIFLTISPQRYLFSEGVPELAKVSPFLDNTLGKSILRVAVEEFIAQNRPGPIIYFPAFEIVTEELRQYETLSTYDYVHINQDLTPKYVVKRFLQAYGSDEVPFQLPLIEKARLLLEQRANLIAGGLNAAEDTVFARQVLTLMETVKTAGHLDRMSPALLNPLADLINGCAGALG